MEAQLALDAGDMAEALRLGTWTRQLGRALRITDLEMLGLATEGLGTEGVRPLMTARDGVRFEDEYRYLIAAR